MWNELKGMSGQKAIDFPLLTIDAVMRIAEDDEASEIFKVYAKPEDVDVKTWFMGRIISSKLALQKRHSEDVAIILAANECVSVEEWKEHLTMETYEADLYAMLADQYMRSFFAQAQTKRTSL